MISNTLRSRRVDPIGVRATDPQAGLPERTQVAAPNEPNLERERSVRMSVCRPGESLQSRVEEDDSAALASKCSSTKRTQARSPNEPRLAHGTIATNLGGVRASRDLTIDGPAIGRTHAPHAAHREISAAPNE